MAVSFLQGNEFSRIIAHIAKFVKYSFQARQAAMLPYLPTASFFDIKINFLNF